MNSIFGTRGLVLAGGAVQSLQKPGPMQKKAKRLRGDQSRMESPLGTAVLALQHPQETGEGLTGCPRRQGKALNLSHKVHKTPLHFLTADFGWPEDTRC